MSGGCSVAPAARQGRRQVISVASTSSCSDEDQRSRYEGVGEAEAALAQQDPLPPEVFPAAAPPPPKQTRATTLRGGSGSDGDGKLPLPLTDRDVMPEPVETHKQVHMAHEMLAGSMASVVSRFCVAPLDVLKIRFQIQEQASQHRQYTGVTMAFRSIYQKEGLMAFWKGNAAAELMVVPYGAVSFVAYSKCKSWFPIAAHAHSRFASYQHLSSLVAGSFAGFCATISTYPLDLLRTRFAAQQQHRVYRSLTHAAKHIIEREGIGGLYTGMCPTLIGIVPLMALQFGSYEAFKQAIRNAKADQDVDPNSLQLTFVEQSCAGFSAGVISKYLTMPLDVIKKRFQVSGFELPLNHHNNHAAPTPAPAAHAHSAAQAAAVPVLAPAPVPVTSPSAPAVPAATLPVQAQSVLTHHAPGTSSAPPSASVAFTATPLVPSARTAQSATQLPSAHAQSLTPPSFPSTHAHLAPPPTMRAAAAAVTASAEAAAAGAVHGAVPAPAPHVFGRRRRRHDQPVAGRRPFTGVLDCARGIVAHEGIAGLWKGSVPSILKAGPNSAIIYMVYEYTIRWLNRNFDGHFCSINPSADPSKQSTHKFNP